MTEQAQGARAQAQVEAKAEAAEVVDKEAPGKGEWVVVPQALVVIAFVPTVVKEKAIHSGGPVMNSNAPSAVRR